MVSRVLTYLIATALFVVVQMADGRAEVVFRISSENTPQHIQTKVLEHFAEVLAQRTRGQLKVRYHHSAELFRDRDVVKALADGKIEMAVPGMWQLDRYEPNIGLFMLPSFYGQPRATHYRIRDGELGATVNKMVEDTLGVKVVGRWIDLGYAHLFFTGHDVRSHASLKGLRIRIAGGEANRDRIETLGAQSVLIPWPDFPTALAARQVDGVLTTHETVASAELWKYGIKHGFEDKQYFAQYVPMISIEFWDRISPSLRKIIRETWEEIVDPAREQAAQAQAEAREDLLMHDVMVVEPPQSELDVWRQRLLKGEAALAERMGVSTDLLARAHKMLP